MSSLKAWSAFANANMQKKLIFIFVILIIVPLIMATFISYQYYNKTMTHKVTDYINEISSKILNKLDGDIDDIKKISITPEYFSDFIGYLQEPEQNLVVERNMDIYLSMFMNIKQTISTIYIFDEHGKLHYNTKANGIRSDIRNSYLKWNHIARQAGGAPVLLGTQKITDARHNTQYVFSVVREIKNSALEPIATLVIDADISVIEEAVKQLDAVTGGHTIIIDDSNHVIYNSNKSLITQDLSGNELVRRAGSNDGSYRMSINGQDHLVTYKTSPISGWRVFVYIPVKEMTKDVERTRDVTLLATVTIIGLALIIFIAISYLMTKPLKKIVGLMKLVQNGNFDVKFNFKYRDEIGELGNHFNRMIQRIKELIEEVYINQLRKKQAQLEAMQSQINPHFIYNTLESIRMTAEVNDDEEVSEMLFILGKMLRYSVNRGSESVTVMEELEHLVHYIFLQNYRFNNRIKLDIQLDNDMKKVQVIKLLFQPIVENAIFHGLEEKEGTSTISISSEIDGDCVYFIVKDDGVGMSTDTLRQLKERLADDALFIPSSFGIGLRNVNERIKLYYGEEYGLEVESALGEGAKVKLKLPYSVLS